MRAKPETLTDYPRENLCMVIGPCIAAAVWSIVIEYKISKCLNDSLEQIDKNQNVFGRATEIDEDTLF